MVASCTQSMDPWGAMASPFSTLVDMGGALFAETEQKQFVCCSYVKEDQGIVRDDFPIGAANARTQLSRSCFVLARQYIFTLGWMSQALGTL